MDIREPIITTESVRQMATKTNKSFSLTKKDGNARFSAAIVNPININESLKLQNLMSEQRNWWELKITGDLPPRRAYHSSFVHNKKMYVMGGKDIGTGLMDCLWQIEFSQLLEFVPGESEYHPNPQWKKINCTGISKPKPVCNHTSVIFEGKMYLFGGIISPIVDPTSPGLKSMSGGGPKGENQDMYTLELEKFQWKIIKPKPIKGDKFNLPGPRDEHSAVVYLEAMYVFGGFMQGVRTNDLFKFHFKSSCWERIDLPSEEIPQARAGHSAVLYSDEVAGDFMYIFGGKGDNSVKLNDIWRFDFIEMSWFQIFVNSSPTPRSGHAATIFKDYMIIFGGLHDKNSGGVSDSQASFNLASSSRSSQYKPTGIAKELNDIHVFDLRQEIWVSGFNNLPTAPSPKRTKTYNELTVNTSPHRSMSKHDIFLGGSATYTQQHILLDSKRPTSFLKIKPEDAFYSQGPGSIADKLRIKKPSHRFGMPPSYFEKLRKQNSRFDQGSKSSIPGKKGSGHQPQHFTASQLLSDPTSRILRDKELVKNADPSFDKAYEKIRRRQRRLKSIQGGSSKGISEQNSMEVNSRKFGNQKASFQQEPASELLSPGMSPESFFKNYDPSLTKMSGKRPHPRDGHTGVVVGSNLFVFGGDRYHMPYNDLYLLDLLSEFEEKGLIDSSF